MCGKKMCLEIKGFGGRGDLDRCWGVAEANFLCVAKRNDIVRVRVNGHSDE